MKLFGLRIYTKTEYCKRVTEHREDARRGMKERLVTALEILNDKENLKLFEKLSQIIKFCGLGD